MEQNEDIGFTPLRSQRRIFGEYHHLTPQVLEDIHKC